MSAKASFGIPATVLLGLIGFTMALTASRSEAATAGSLQTSPSCLRDGGTAHVFGSGWQAISDAWHYEFFLDNEKIAEQRPDVGLLESPNLLFTVPATTSPGQHTITVKLLRTQDGAVILEKSIQVFVLGPGAVGVTESITGFGSCPPAGSKTPTWGSFGVRPILEADSGERLEVECAEATTSFNLLYAPAGGLRALVGVCPFQGGCNSAWFSHAGNTNPANDKPDCFVMTQWLSRDYKKNDSGPSPATATRTGRPNPWTGEHQENALDHAMSIFDIGTYTLKTLGRKYTYRVGPPVPMNACRNPSLRPEGDFVGEIPVYPWDPWQGATAEAFLHEGMVRREAIPAPTPSMEDPIQACDFNEDGSCDAVDFQIFRAALGHCLEESSYNPGADLDGDGCVTSLDFQIWAGLTRLQVISVQIDITPGKFPNSISLGGQDLITVAILTTPLFDATALDPLSVVFGPNGAGEAHRQGHIEDVDGDGENDLLLHFNTQDTGIECGDTSTALIGAMLSGGLIVGTDSVQTVGCDRR